MVSEIGIDNTTMQIRSIFLNKTTNADTFNLFKHQRMELVRKYMLMYFYYSLIAMHAYGNSEITMA